MTQPKRPALPMDPALGDASVEPILEKKYAPKSQPATGERVAIIVNHGMGQQVPFETLELVAESVWRAAKVPLTDTTEAQPFVTGARGLIQPPIIRRVRLGMQDKNDVEIELQRVEMSFTDAKDKKHEVHFYEAYWAPLTEGKVTIRDVIAFLFRGGWDGLRNCAVGFFQRWMFGRMQVFRFRRWLRFIYLGFIVLLLVSLLVINAVIAAAAASHAIGGSGKFPTGELLAALTSDFLIIDLATLLVFLGTFAIPRVYRWASNKKTLPVWLGWTAWVLVIVGAITLTVVGYVMLAQLSGYRPEDFLWPQAVESAKWITNHSLLTSVVWGLAVVGAAGARWALVEYVGDVAAYIAAHTVSKFWELRQQIWQTAMKVARAVYRTTTPDGENFYYPRVIMVGHSLGSIIAYDVLNGMLLEEGYSAQRLYIAERTRMLVTFGSPLDKTAFIFRTQADADSEIREVAAAGVQPMIAAYANRPQEWMNIYSHSDVIASKLHFYDDAGGAGGAKRVKNKKDPEARTPLAAHTEYWHGELLAKTLYRAITT